MPEFFHVDRDACLSEGQVLGLDRHSFSTARQRKVADELFPEGVSNWGVSMLGHDPPLDLPDTAIKLIDNAGLYWAGCVRNDSCPWQKEVLLPPPVTVVGRVM